MINGGTNGYVVSNELTWDTGGEWIVEFEAQFDRVDGKRFGIQSVTQGTSRDNYLLGYHCSSYYLRFGYATTSGGSTNVGDYNDKNNHQIKIVAHNNIVYFYFDGTLKKTITDYSWINESCRIFIGTWGSGKGYFKNLKIKPYTSE